MNPWLESLVNDINNVGLPLAIGILVVGVALLVISFIVKSKEA